MNWLLIAVGGALGAVVRAGVVQMLVRFSPSWPLGTLVVNTVGCVLIGMLAGAGIIRGSPPWALLATGVLGGFTTFSAFGLDVHDQMVQAHWGGAALYMVLSLIGAVAGVAVGQQIGRLWPV
jgi:CrcB protein